MKLYSDTVETLYHTNAHAEMFYNHMCRYNTWSPHHCDTHYHVQTISCSPMHVFPVVSDERWMCKSLGMYEANIKCMINSSLLSAQNTIKKMQHGSKKKKCTHTRFQQLCIRLYTSSGQLSGFSMRCPANS